MNKGLIILLALLIAPVMVSALELNYPVINNITLESGMQLNELVGWLYSFIVGIAGLAAFVALVWGGVQWMTSGGSPSKIFEAKDRISSALLGLIIILMSYLILNTINPELTVLRAI